MNWFLVEKLVHHNSMSKKETAIDMMSKAMMCKTLKLLKLPRNLYFQYTSVFFFITVVLI